MKTPDSSILAAHLALQGVIATVVQGRLTIPNLTLNNSRGRRPGDFGDVITQLYELGIRPDEYDIQGLENITIIFNSR